jgi:hypothetical protein
MRQPIHEDIRRFELTHGWFRARWDIVAAILIILMAALMLGPARRDSATVDETTVLGAGYAFFRGYGYKMQPEHPPLSQMLIVAPLLPMDLTMSDDARGLLEGRLSYQWTRPWFGPPLSIQPFIPTGCQGRIVPLRQPPFHPLVEWQCSGAYPSLSWYYWSLPEGQLFGQILVYGSGNDADAMLFSARCVQILITLGVGILIFWWVRCVTKNALVAVAALGTWVFNPNALAYGHLVSTGDIGVTLGMTAALFFFARFMENPTVKTGAVCGIATGVALVMKFTAITLAPIFLILAAISWKQLGRRARDLWKPGAVLIGTAWLVLLVIYFPRWSPPPLLSEQQAQLFGVPGWFSSFRVLLIPADFFKGLALTLGHSKGGHEAYLLGRWSREGWWYYDPLAFLFKNPLAFVILTVTSVVILAKRFQWASTRALEFTPWAASIMYLLAAMTSNANIGVRHLLPIFPLLCVGIGLALAKVASRSAQWAAFTLIAWQATVTLLAYPLYIQFFSEVVGGAPNGYKYLIDSNYDWGQDAKRLKEFLDDHGITHIYLDYFGTQYNIEYLKIPNTRVNAEQAKQLQDGWLVVSASQLMQDEWKWLRESREPTARVADTLFVYHLGG